jgi:hypothetical protein
VELVADTTYLFLWHFQVSKKYKLKNIIFSLKNWYELICTCKQLFKILPKLLNGIFWIFQKTSAHTALDPCPPNPCWLELPLQFWVMSLQFRFKKTLWICVFFSSTVSIGVLVGWFRVEKGRSYISEDDAEVSRISVLLGWFLSSMIFGKLLTTSISSISSWTW